MRARFAAAVRRYSATSETVATAKGQLRRNACSGDWVCIMSERASRPQQTMVLRADQKTTAGPSHDPDCPFCKGNEDQTSEPLLQIGTKRDWSLRIVKNKYPALTPPEGDMATSGILCDAIQIGSFSRRFGTGSGTNGTILDSFADAFGAHEVVIETPHHNLPLACDDVLRVERLVRAWRDRGRQLIGWDGEAEARYKGEEGTSEYAPIWRHLLYFKNQGSGGGATIMHPHSQLVALPIVPETVQRSQATALRWFQENGVGVWAQMIEEEMELAAQSTDNCRIVDENESFVALVPFAALSPYSMWILPKEDAAHFEQIDEAGLVQFASLLHRCLRRMHIVLDEPDFNLIVRSAPVADRGRQRAFNAGSYYRWHATLFPRMGAGAMGGFEFASGIFSNSHIPEDDARELREVTL